jgi:hypothetical protein
MRQAIRVEQFGPNFGSCISISSLSLCGTLAPIRSFVSEEVHETTDLNRPGANPQKKFAPILTNPRSAISPLKMLRKVYRNWFKIADGTNEATRLQ